MGRWLISFAIGLVQKGLTRQRLEPTLLRFIGNTISVVLNITLVIAILGYFGVQTNSFAAGVFLVVLRPFKVGDFISAGGISDNIQNFSTNPYRRVDLTAQISGAGCGHCIFHSSGPSVNNSALQLTTAIIGRSISTPIRRSAKF